MIYYKKKWNSFLQIYTLFHFLFSLNIRINITKFKRKKKFLSGVICVFCGWILIQYSVLYKSYRLWIQWNLETLNDENNIDKIIDSWSNKSTALLKCQLIF